jgi:hypothetical protein
MSSYLLLRNNKESGPFTIEEIQGMSLKAYDLIWVVGKSAAWRYPGEIQDLKSFAPPVPEQLTDLYARKSGNKKSDSIISAFEDSSQIKISEPVANRTRETNGQKTVPGRLVYVNLPAEKKPSPKHQDRILFEPVIPDATNQEPAYDFSDLYKKRPSGTSHFSGKILWVSTLILLFGTGILTGFFISDRRKFFSTAEKPTHKKISDQPSTPVNRQEISTPNKLSGIPAGREAHSRLSGDSSKIDRISTGKSVNGQKKKPTSTGTEKKDADLNIPALSPAIPLQDSLKQSSLPGIDMLFQQIKAHPENYVSLQAGRYSTGVFGGISSFPITLTNNSQVLLDLVVYVDYIQNNEKIFKTESLSFNNLEPGESVTLKAPKSPRGVRISTHLHVLNTQSADPATSK